jgi:hypothetical protein
MNGEPAMERFYAAVARVQERCGFELADALETSMVDARIEWEDAVTDAQLVNLHVGRRRRPSPPRGQPRRTRGARP